MKRIIPIILLTLLIAAPCFAGPRDGRISGGKDKLEEASDTSGASDYVLSHDGTDPKYVGGGSARDALGLGASDSPTFAGATLGSAELVYTNGELWAVNGGVTVPVTGQSTAYGISYDEATDAITRTGALAGYAVSSSPGDDALPIQAAMRRCLLDDAGNVVEYLDADDSTVTLGGAKNAILSGASGQVMVQVPAFYYRYAETSSGVSNTHGWSISTAPRDGYSIHPWFFKDGTFVPYRYIGAYEGVWWDAANGYQDSTGDHTDQDGLGDTLDTANDMLSSVSGYKPLTDETRDEFRAIASNRGTGWRQLEWLGVHAIQLLYLIEYADFDVQGMIGNGCVSYVSFDFDESVAPTGLSNSDGNGTNASDSAFSSVAVDGTQTNGVEVSEYSTYRGIENFYGSVWEFVDGINVDNHVVYLCNDSSDFADDTRANYYATGVTLWGANGYPGSLAASADGFFPTGSGGSSATYTCDYFYQNTGWRVVLVGAYANDDSKAGLFCVLASTDSANDSSSIGGRLCF